ncbi:hypothetical protein PYW07_012322 [Mythimna separata]|uniref:Peptidase S1 domain-containing protein n=1 Tax=Mythimna separata TaxID=271217 RepID=A0AAD7YMK3_MYTSE|nr:hypothetical protein PYW07_012322 [Mythimna separata]
MKSLTVVLLALVAVASARHITLEDVVELEKNPVYDYINRVSVPLAEEIRKAEEEGRIVGGSLAHLGQFPYQAGFVLRTPSGGQALSGGVLVSRNRILSAAHNFADSVSSVSALTVVLGSTTIFSGGTRLTPSRLVLHESYIANPVRNDLAMVSLATNVGTSNIIAPIALPSGAQLNENFVNNIAVASGWGKTNDIGGVVANQQLHFVNLRVITNQECTQTYGNVVQATNICTSGEGGRNICTGDSGGPLAVNRNNRPILIGITSFGSIQCQTGRPSAYARVTSFISWINRNL